jgi:hypothetical protein
VQLNATGSLCFSDNSALHGNHTFNSNTGKGSKVALVFSDTLKQAPAVAYNEKAYATQSS